MDLSGGKTLIATRYGNSGVWRGLKPVDGEAQRKRLERARWATASIMEAVGADGAGRMGNWGHHDLSWAVASIIEVTGSDGLLPADEGMVVRPTHKKVNNKVLGRLPTACNTGIKTDAEP